MDYVGSCCAEKSQGWRYLLARWKEVRKKSSEELKPPVPGLRLP